jgi:hypothetical protein
VAKTKQEVITDLKSLITSNGGAFGEWYVGLCKNASEQLSKVHHVDAKQDKWIYRTALSPALAREIEYYFVKILGAEGSAGPSDETAQIVYAYKKSERTDP